MHCVSGKNDLGRQVNINNMIFSIPQDFEKSVGEFEEIVWNHNYIKGI